MKVLIVEWVISHAHLTKMMKELKKKQHKDFGFYFEFEDIGNVWSRSKTRSDLYDPPNGKSKIFGDYNGKVEGGILRVYRDLGVTLACPVNVVPQPIPEGPLSADEIRVLKQIAQKVLAAEKILAGEA